jgi:hypothetical protein
MIIGTVPGSLNRFFTESCGWASHWLSMLHCGNQVYLIPLECKPNAHPDSCYKAYLIVSKISSLCPFGCSK